MSTKSGLRTWSVLAPKGALMIGATLLLAAGCGRGEVSDETLLEFPNAPPRAPAELPMVNDLTGSSARPIAATEKHVLVVDRDNGDLVWLDRQSLERDAAVYVGEAPEQVLVGRSGDVWVSVAGSGEVVRIAPDSTEIAARVHLGGEPRGLALAPGGLALYVTLATANELVALDPHTLAERERYLTGERPLALVASYEGRLAVVHQHGEPFLLPILDDGLLDGHRVRSGTLRTNTPTDAHFFPQRAQRIVATRSTGAALNPKTGIIYVAHVQATPGTEDELLQMARGLAVDPSAPPPNPVYYGLDDSAGIPVDLQGLPTRPVEGVVSALNADGVGVVHPREPVQDPRTGEPMSHLIADPSDVNHHPAWSLAFTVGHGSDNVLVYNTGVATDPMTDPLALIDVGRGPRAIAFSPDGAWAYVLNGHDLTVSEIDLSPFFDMGAPDTETQVMHLRPVRTAEYGVDPLPVAVREGARAFTHARNPRLSRKGHFSCNTCHMDGGEDKLVWVVTVGPRQTPALAGRLADTAPFNWNGTKHDLQDNMRRTVGRMGGTGLEAEELASVEQFLLHGLRAPVNPTKQRALTPEEELGKVLFNDPEVGCSTCHAGAGTTDGLVHRAQATPAEIEAWTILKERGENETDNPNLLNTPSLRDVALTAPYLHDGSAMTILDVLEQTSSWMGNTHHLSEDELRALAAYTLTL